MSLSLKRIRNIIDEFFKSCAYINYQYVSLFKFVSLIGEEKNSVFEQVFEILASKNKKHINMYEFFVMIIVSSFANKLNKQKMLFMLFNLSRNMRLSEQESILYIQVLCKAMAKFAGGIPVKDHYFQIIGKQIFRNANVGNESTIAFVDIEYWQNGCYELSEMFAKYEPSSKVRENSLIFLPFKKISNGDFSHKILKNIILKLPHRKNTSSNIIGELNKVKCKPKKKQKRIRIESWNNTNPDLSNLFKIKKLYSRIEKNDHRKVILYGSKIFSKNCDSKINEIQSSERDNILHRNDLIESKHNLEKSISQENFYQGYMDKQENLLPILNWRRFSDTRTIYSKRNQEEPLKDNNPELIKTCGKNFFFKKKITEIISHKISKPYIQSSGYLTRFNQVKHIKINPTKKGNIYSISLKDMNNIYSYLFTDKTQWQNSDNINGIKIEISEILRKKIKQFEQENKRIPTFKEFISISQNFNFPINT